MFSELTTFLNGDSAVSALKNELGLATTLDTRTGLALAEPTLVANFAHWLNEPESEVWYHTVIQTVSPESLADFNSLSAAQDFRDLGERGLDQLFGDRRSEVVGLVAKRAEISDTASYGLLAATAWTMTVAMSRFEESATWEDARSTFAEKYAALLEQGWGVWLDKVVPGTTLELSPTTTNGFVSDDIAANDATNTSVELVPDEAQTAPTGTNYLAPPANHVAATGGQPYLADEVPAQDIESGSFREHVSERRDHPVMDRSRGASMLWVVGFFTLLAILALFVASSLLGGRSSEPELAGDQTQEANSSVDSLPGSTTTQPGALLSDDQAAADNTESSSDETGNTSAAEPTTDSEDIDDWPGGRGPVPDTPPARRVFEIDPDGELVLTGSAPSWELAQQVLQEAENNFPASEVSISNQLTWHPDASTSARSGDAIIAQAATFSSGSAEIEPESILALDLAADILKSGSSIYVVVIGHADANGDEASNVSLSAERVNSVVEFLLSQEVIPGQIVTAAAGEDDPTQSNETADGRQSNRRVELVFKNYLAPPIGESK